MADNSVCLDEIPRSDAIRKPEQPSDDLAFRGWQILALGNSGSKISELRPAEMKISEVPRRGRWDLGSGHAGCARAIEHDP